MNTSRVRMILGRLREAALPKGGGLSDGQLLGQFISRRDDAAFQALVRRHGPMVLAVCRRVLRHAQDAEDAFQAAFLVLARRAASVADREAVAGWLHGVAYRSALCARAAALRRQRKERQVENMPHPVAPPEDDQRELLERLDRELARLPEKYRLPVVLCELEGRSRKEAAQQLGLPEGTLSSQLATARKTLAARLSGGGAAISAAALGTLFIEGTRAACVPGRLLVSTVRVAGGTVPAGVAALTEGVMKSLLLTKLKATAWGLLLAASISVGAITLTYRPAAAQPAPEATPPLVIQPAPMTTPPLVVQPTPQGTPQPAAKASPNRDELEALRLEVEALRMDLKATKERVKALEEKAQPQLGDGPYHPYGGLTGTAAKDKETIYRTGSGTFAGQSDGPMGKGPIPDPTGKGSAADAFFFVRQVDTPGDLDAAMQKLRQHPDDKPALCLLERAIQRLKDEADQFKAKVQEKCDDARKLEEFEHSVQKLKGAPPLAPLPPKPAPTPPIEK